MKDQKPIEPKSRNEVASHRAEWTKPELVRIRAGAAETGGGGGGDAYGAS